VSAAALVYSAGLAYSGFQRGAGVSGLHGAIYQLGQIAGPVAWLAYVLATVLALVMVGTCCSASPAC